MTWNNRQHNCQLSLESATISITKPAAVTPSHVLPLRGNDYCTAVADITDPPQLNLFRVRQASISRPIRGCSWCTSSEQGVRRRNGHASDSYRRNASRDIKVQIITWWSCRIQLQSANSHSSHILLDVPIVNKDNKKVPQMKAVLNQLMSVGDPGIEDMMVESARWLNIFQDGFCYDFCFSRVGDLEKQAIIRAWCEHRAMNPQVFMRRESVARRFKGKRKNKGPTAKTAKTKSIPESTRGKCGRVIY